MITDSSIPESEVLANRVGPAETIAQNHSSKEIDANERHLSTDHLLTNLRRRTISSGLVTAAAQGAQFFLNLGYIMVLARLLVPQEFGLVAMVTTVTGFLRIFHSWLRQRRQSHGSIANRGS